DGLMRQSVPCALAVCANVIRQTTAAAVRRLALRTARQQVEAVRDREFVETSEVILDLQRLFSGGRENRGGPSCVRVRRALGAPLKLQRRADIAREPAMASLRQDFRTNIVAAGLESISNSLE